jgi:signal transduction histidine kinase
MHHAARYARLVRILRRDSYVLRHANRRREAGENSLRQANEDLEKRVAERTHKLAEQKTSLQLHARELERANADLERFAFAASHDLQEPLRAMAGCAQTLERKYQEDGHPYRVWVMLNPVSGPDGIVRGFLVVEQQMRNKQFSTRLMVFRGLSPMLCG